MYFPYIFVRLGFLPLVLVVTLDLTIHFWHPRYRRKAQTFIFLTVLWVSKMDSPIKSYDQNKGQKTEKDKNIRKLHRKMQKNKNLIIFNDFLAFLTVKIVFFVKK